MKKRTTKGKKFIKKYLISSLLDSEVDIINRIRLIERVSQEFYIFPETKFFFDRDWLIYSQDYVDAKDFERLREVEKFKLIENFCIGLDQLEGTGFVHGDIHRQNIIYDGSSLKLVDLEPGFRQLIKGKRVIKACFLTRSINDFKQNLITTETDRISFYYMLRRIFKRSYVKISPKILKEERKRGVEILPLEEKVFIRLGFFEIYKVFKQELEVETLTPNY